MCQIFDIKLNFRVTVPFVTSKALSSDVNVFTITLPSSESLYSLRVSAVPSNRD